MRNFFDECTKFKWDKKNSGSSLASKKCVNGWYKVIDISIYLCILIWV